MNGPAPRIHVVDDDASVRKGLERLLRSAGFDARSYGSAHEFLDRPPDDERPCCAVVDVLLPELNGLDLQRKLVAAGSPVPVIFITGHGDIPTGVRAMKDGAVDFLPKPFDEAELLDAVDRAIARSEREREARRKRTAARNSVARLTPREREVMRFVIAGFLNKQIGQRLDIAEKTVKVHRGRVMHKLDVGSVADLVRLAEKAEIPPAE